MECLKVFEDLEKMADSLKIGFFKHLYLATRTYDKLKGSVGRHLHIRDIDVAEYRIAQQLLSDWLYGWDVNMDDDTTRHRKSVDATNTVDDYRVTKVPRKISLDLEAEKLEISKIIKAFENISDSLTAMLKRWNSQLQNWSDELFSDTLQASKFDGGIGLALKRISSMNNDKPKNVKISAIQSTKKKESKHTSSNHKHKEAKTKPTTQSNTTSIPSKNTTRVPAPDQNNEDSNNQNDDILFNDDDNGDDDFDDKFMDQLELLQQQSGFSGGNKLHKSSKVKRENSSGAILSDAENGSDNEHGDSKPKVKRTVDDIYHLLDTITDYTILRSIYSLVALGLAEAMKSHEKYQEVLTGLISVLDRFTTVTFKYFAFVLAKDFENDPLTSVEIKDDKIFKAWIKKYAAVFLESNTNFKGSVMGFGAPAAVGSLANLPTGIIGGNAIDPVNTTTPSNGPAGTPSPIPASVLYGKKITNGHKKVPRIYQKFQYLSKLMAAIDIHILPNNVLAHKRGVKCMQYCYLNSIFWVTGGYDGVIRIFDVPNQQCLSQFVGHKSIVTDLQVAKKDTHVVSSSFDRTIKIWNTQTGICEKTLVGHTDAVLSVDLSPGNQQFIASSSIDMTARIWDFKTGACIASVKRHSKWIKMVRFSPDGLHLATASMDHKVYIWDMKVVLNNSKNMTYTRCIDAHQDSILCIAMKKPNLLLTSSRDHQVKLFDYITGTEIHSVTLAPSWACTVNFNHDGSLFAAGCFDSTVSIYKTKTGERIRYLRSFNLGILCIAFPEHDQYVICGTSDGYIQQLTL